jgi:hypothetical protein
MIETGSAERKGIYLRTTRSLRVGKTGIEKGLRRPQRARIHPNMNGLFPECAGLKGFRSERGQSTIRDRNAGLRLKLTPVLSCFRFPS